MNYGVLLSQELQKQAFPIGALIGGGIGTGFGILGSHLGKFNPLGTGITVAGLSTIGTIIGDAIQKEKEQNAIANLKILKRRF